MSDSFTHAELPHLGKNVLRIGIAGNYGLDEKALLHGASRGANFWLWNPRYPHITGALKQIMKGTRDQHVVAALGTVCYSAGAVRRLAESALRSLSIEQLDVLLLPWLGRASLYTGSIQETLVRLKEEGKIRCVGTSIHDRKRAGELVRDSVLDAFMIRYNAKHPGAERDIFPHLAKRDPLVVAYTATSWRQLLKPVARLDMPPWPGKQDTERTPPPLEPGQCYRFCLTSPHVHVVWTAPKTLEQLNENLDALAEGPLPDDEYAWVRKYGAQLKARKRFLFL